MASRLRAMGSADELLMASENQSGLKRPCAIKALLRSFVVLIMLALPACAQTTAGTESGVPQKRVVVDKTAQELIAYEGDRIVLRSHVSTGRMGRRTPSGQFIAGVKLRMHYSRLYDNAPMPWSVQVNGNYFIHGFTSVPDRPASHGCIRLPLTGDNPAKQFFDWVEPGTPIEIAGEWTPPPKTKPATTKSPGRKEPSAPAAAR
jgi:hypothetical protein